MSNQAIVEDESEDATQLGMGWEKYVVEAAEDKDKHVRLSWRRLQRAQRKNLHYPFLKVVVIPETEEQKQPGNSNDDNVSVSQTVAQEKSNRISSGLSRLFVT